MWYTKQRYVWTSSASLFAMDGLETIFQGMKAQPSRKKVRLPQNKFPFFPIQKLWRYQLLQSTDSVTSTHKKSTKTIYIVLSHIIF